MKKSLITLLLSVICTSLVFAIDLSIGCSGIYEKSDQSLVYYGTVDSYGDQDWAILGERVMMDRWGAEVFVDTAYAVATFGYRAFSQGVAGYSGLVGDPSHLTIMDGSSTYLTFSLYGKLPLGNKDSRITFFPLAGGEFLLNLSYEDGNGDDLKEDLSNDELADLNEIWLKAGLGADIDIGERTFFRITGIAGYKVRSSLESERQGSDTRVSEYLSLLSDMGTADLEESPRYMALDFGVAIGLGFKL